MNKILIFVILFLASCTTKTVNNNLDFSNELSLEEFKIKLNEYAKNSSYPNIDE
tara:strand:+ start:372 stop:533 length:162 start_codon:yes stop_codon:yes gene_type:complete